jgi:hypothetical protein
MMTLAFDLDTYLAANAALRFSAARARQCKAPELAAKFDQALAELQRARDSWIERQIDTTPAFLRRQAE